MRQLSLASILTHTLLLSVPGLAQDVQPDREPGLTLRLFQLGVSPEVLPVLVESQTPNVDRRVAQLELAGDDFEGVTAPHLTQVLGFLMVEKPGMYRLRLRSDDGSRLSLDGLVVVDNDGRHGMKAVESSDLTLGVGEHVLFVEHFDSGGACGLELEWRRPGNADFESIPESALRCEADPTRVTAPGTKAIVDDRRPGFGLPLEGVHPGWRVETIRPEGFEAQVGSMCFLPDGRLAFGTFDPLQRDEVALPDIESKAPDTIWALDVDSGELGKIASDVFEPTGLCVADGQLFVAHRRKVERLVDADGDGFFETHELVGEGWEGWNYHQFAFGLEHRDGRLYTALSTTMAPPGWEGMETNAGPNGPLRGSVLEIDIATGDVQVLAAGARTPNGLGCDDEGRLFYADNQGSWFPASALYQVLPGRFFGHRNWTRFVPKLSERYPLGGHPSIWCDRPRVPPTLWLPHGEVVNSPTTPLPYRGEPFDGQLLLGELTAGGIRRAFLEEVDGVLQGALFRFTQGFESGINRMVWGEDGAIYVGGIGAGGNWNWKQTRFGLQRLVPESRHAFEFHSVQVRPDGFRLRFTEPLEPELALDLSRYTAESWTYAPTAAYGGPKVARREHEVLGVEPSEDGREVVLRLAGLEEGRVVHLRVDVPSAAGEPLWSGEAWYTLTRLPLGRKANEGLGAWPGPEGVWLLPNGLGAAMSPEERPKNLNEEDVTSRPWAELRPGGAELRSRTAMLGGHLHFEVAAVEASRASLELAWGELRLALPLDASGGRGMTAGEWQSLEARRSEDGRRLVVRRIRGADSEPFGAILLDPLSDGQTPSEWFSAAAIAFRALGSEGASPIRLRNVWFEPGEGDTRAAASPAADPRGAPWRLLLTEPEAWTARGGEADFRLEDGVLVGETRPNTPNTFFTTRERFADFELTYEVRIDPELNSGVQIRSEVVGGFDQRSGGLVGVQVEIDPSERAWSAGLYEERGRGWLHPLHTAPYARRAWKQGDWNRFLVVCRGHTIRTWINGVPAAEIHDAVRSEGHLGLQVHGVGGRSEPLQVRWRDLRVRELR